MIFEIINPSDPYTMETDSKEAACVACLFLSAGFGLRSEDGSFAWPIMFCGCDPDATFTDLFGVAMLDWIGEHRALIAEALDSVLVGSIGDRATVKALLDGMQATEEQRTKFLGAWHDQQRTSMNDIGAAAKRMAAKIRDRLQLERAIHHEYKDRYPVV